MQYNSPTWRSQSNMTDEICQACGKFNDACVCNEPFVVEEVSAGLWIIREQATHEILGVVENLEDPDAAEQEAHERVEALNEWKRGGSC